MYKCDKLVLLLFVLFMGLNAGGADVRLNKRRFQGNEPILDSYRPEKLKTPEVYNVTLSSGITKEDRKLFDKQTLGSFERYYKKMGAPRQLSKKKNANKNTVVSSLNGVIEGFADEIEKLDPKEDSKHKKKKKRRKLSVMDMLVKQLPSLMPPLSILHFKLNF